VQGRDSGAMIAEGVRPGQPQSIGRRPAEALYLIEQLTRNDVLGTVRELCTGGRILMTMLLCQKRILKFDLEMLCKINPGHMDN
jgi:hypothetical protein